MALFAACVAGNVGRVCLLLEAGANVNQVDAFHSTALMRASRGGHAECARLLLEVGADANCANVDGRTALAMASRGGHADCVRLLLEAGADANCADADDLTALMSASFRRHTDCARLLLEAGADVLATDATGATALGWGSAWLGVVQLLCTYGARRETLHQTRAPADCRAWVLETSRWSTQLHHLELILPAHVRQLLVGGADVHASDGSGDGAPTPLGLARALLARDPAHEGASLVVAAAAPWSRENHALFPAHARGCAAELMRLGQLLVREARFAGKEGALLDVWPLVVAHALGRSMPPGLVLHSALVGRSATITSQPAGGELLLGRKGIVTAVSAEWESVELELDHGERVSVPVASVELELASTQPSGGAHRLLTATLDELAACPDQNGRRVRLLGWVGSQGCWRAQIDRSRLAPLGVPPASLLALGWELERARGLHALAAYALARDVSFEDEAGRFVIRPMIVDSSLAATMPARVQPPSRVALKLTLAFNAAGELKVAASVTALPRSEVLAPSAKKSKHGERGELEDKRAFRKKWTTSEEGVKANRKLWLRYDPSTNCMFCDACIRFNLKHPTCNFFVGCKSIRLERVKAHECYGESNGHGDALFKLINSTKLAEDFSASPTKQISLESDGLVVLIKNAYWLSKELVPNLKFA
ncbi:hypothetical protein T492DRAFT_907346 [Pavlovales sp. CCMP2436]|nr:hypothetical protein T492DRAFT_907346 [Pavlovales sp. CCMP2436]